MTVHSEGQAWGAESRLRRELLPAANLPAPTPGIQGEWGASREQRTAAGLENLQTFIFVERREEGTHFARGKFKLYICTWIVWKRDDLEEGLRNLSRLMSDYLSYILINGLVFLPQSLSTLQPAAEIPRNPLQAFGSSPGSQPVGLESLFQ